MTAGAPTAPVRATLEDVARTAGVSLATVDRVINRREGVRAKTVARVEAAVAKLGYRADVAAARLARGQSFRFAFVLPTGGNSFMTHLTEQVRHTADWLAGQRGFIDILHVDVFDPDLLAGALETLSPAYHGVAVIALDHPRVRAAIDDLTTRGVAVVTLVSDAPSSRRLHYVGIDNPAAGRTAATLMGRYLGGREGTVAVIAGSLALRDHAERQFGFHQILSSEYPQLRALPPLEGRDDSARTRELTAALLVRHPDLRGIYCCGAGNRGIADALEASGRAREVVWITHELTDHTRRFLVRGTCDAIINQDPGHEARSAARVLLAHCAGEPISPDQERIRIDIFLRDNLP
ncbi:LacI family DNA-binding transcriptional regulator [Bradyrhizobium sp. SSBR45R]|uniref:LacI family DNA-binding transcriptional regulator n=1 Tax=Bradyrhizobium sp. SSBR45R TaxID=2996007 RepID=UPI0024E0CDD4|nr:LacI family DNA-binding transcriptional regulator [Bradyrhizobium sp. SSBR45R]